MIFNRKSPLTVGIVSLLPKEHKFAQVDEITKSILQFSPLLQLTKDNDPDIVISFREEAKKVIVHIARKDCKPHLQANISIDDLNKTQDVNLTLELYKSIYRCFTHDENRYKTWAEEKWIEKHRVDATARTISYKITNLVDAMKPEFPISQGYQQALESMFGKTDTDPQKVQVQGEVIIQGIKDEPGNIEMKLVYTLPDGYYLIKEKNEHSFLGFLSSDEQTSHKVLDQTHTVELNTSNLLHANAQLVAPLIHSPLEWMRVFLFKFYSDWKNSMEEAHDYVVVSHATNETQDLIDHLFVLPENASLPIRLHETINNTKTNKLCQQEIAEVFESNNSIIGSCVDIEIVYGREDVTFEVKFNGHKMGNAIVPVDVLKAKPDRQEIFRDIQERLSKDIVVPLAIYALKPQASA